MGEINGNIYSDISGGFGNQLFMIFNILNLCKEYNLNPCFGYDPDNSTLKKISQYNIFKKLEKFNNNYFNNLNSYNVISEKSFKFNQITNLDHTQNYNIKGYFQSYKYFWKNVDFIKSNLHIDYDKMFCIKQRLHNFNKKTLGIHIRITDNKELKHIYGNFNLNYYQNILSQLNLNEYQIILFSNDLSLASNIIKPLNIKYIKANELFLNDEDQFYTLMLTDVRICSNSTFSLMSCYLNDMYEFNKNSTYYFPLKWYSEHGPEYDIFDLIPIENDKYKFNISKKCVVIFFHKNINSLYPKRWIDKCIKSVLNQKKCNFDIFEINYGNENYSIFENYKLDCKHKFYKKNYATHTEAMLFLLNTVFNKYNYDLVFNTNLDDYYNYYRFIYQYIDIIKNKNLLNSSLWTYIEESDNKNKICKSLPVNTIIYENNEFKWKCMNNILGIDDNEYYNENILYKSIQNQLLINNNIINHSGVCFTKNFWKSTDKFKNKLRYRNDKPYEDLSLWRRAVENNHKIGVVNKNLIYYRIHQNQIGSKNKNKDKLSNEEFEQFKLGPDLRDKRFGKLLLIKYLYNFTDTYKTDISIAAEHDEHPHDEHQHDDNFVPRVDFYFLYVKDDIVEKLTTFLKQNKINNYTLIPYTKKLRSIKNIMSLFDVNIELNCDKLDISQITSNFKNIKNDTSL